MYILYRGQASVFYCGNDYDAGIMFSLAMNGGEWRSRLAQAVAESGKSMREVSLSSGCSAGYLHGILKDGKDPSIERLVKICQVLNVSLAWIVLGIELSPAQERLLLLLAEMRDDEKTLLLGLAEKLVRGNDET